MKHLLSLFLVFSLTLTLSACGTEPAEDAAKGDGTASTGEIWQYSYAGVEHPYLTAISNYLAAYDAENLEIKDGMIPCITALQIDNDDDADIKVWGIFDIYNYSLKDKVLVEENGTRLMGLFHLCQDQNGTAVTDASFVDEGDTDAIEALCEDYDLALNGMKDPVVTEESRRWYISQFVEAEGLDADHYQPAGSDPLPLAYEPQPSPDEIADLPEASETDSLIIVDITVGSNAILTMHEKDADGNWQQTLDEAAFIGKNGPGKTKEGDLMTPLGTLGFNAALGILDDPGCTAFEYTKVDDSHYWDADSNSDRYNTLVSTNDYTDFNLDDSEHIVDYPNAYKYILNTTYNEEGTPNKGSAIFLHCYREERTYTGGCISIPVDKMEYVMTHIQPDSKIILRMLER